MRQAAGYFPGEQDFASFCSTGSQAETTVRTSYHLDVKQIGDLFRIQVSGNGFLYNMVRIIAGTLIEVGKGKLCPTKLPCILDSLDRAQAGPTAPACGLTLEQYEFL